MPGAKEEKKQEPSEGMKPWLELTQAKAFLSTEFLMWVWHLTESPKNPLELRLASLGHTAASKLWIDDRIVLESLDGRAHVHTLKGGDPSRSCEAESALISGKQIRELRLGLHIDPYGDFTVILGSKDLSPKSIVLPSGPDKADGRKNPVDLAYRLKATDILLEALDALFSLFLEERTNQKAWIDKRREIVQWIASRGNSETHLH